MRFDYPGVRLSQVCSVEAERGPDSAVLRLHGEFDLSSDKRFGDELAVVLADEPGTLVVDLRGLTFMDSTGLRVLVSLHNLSDQEGFDYAVLCENGSVRRVLHETGLDDILPVIDPSGAVPATDSAV